jgi:1-hydroxycarotenoid 3,4-desaturase
MVNKKAVIVGAGVGGLVAAVLLANKGVEVTVLERAGQPGGKMREVAVGGRYLDAGPTVFTMRSVFDEVFAEAGASIEDYLELRPLVVLARHAWSEDERLDLFADVERSAEAIGGLCGPQEARRFLGFCEAARGNYQALERTFIRASRPNPVSLVGRILATDFRGLWKIQPFGTLWNALGRHLRDPRLQQLFGRYSTYCGSSPFLAPATLMLIAHVEQQGVWSVEGGMHRTAEALATLARERGATIRYGSEVTEILTHSRRAAGVELASGEQLQADALVVNADVAALRGGRFGETARKSLRPDRTSERSLSAVTWNLVAKTEGFPLLRHSVFFSRDYASEFKDIFQRAQLPREPTVYICAHDRDDSESAAPRGEERLLCLINAPPVGDSHLFESSEIEQCESRVFSLLERYGLHVHRNPKTSSVTTPNGFHKLFPETGGALYGQASHGWRASFKRPATRTRLPGLYLAGGSVHPGAGVPMAALSGRLAATCVLSDLTSTTR